MGTPKKTTFQAVRLLLNTPGMTESERPLRSHTHHICDDEDMVQPTTFPNFGRIENPYLKTALEQHLAGRKITPAKTPPYGCYIVR